MVLLAAAPGESGAGVVRDLLVILGSGALLAVALRRLRVALVPAYLLTGAVIGPEALGLVPDPEAVGSISRLAILLLLFGVGLDLHLSALKADLPRLLAVGAGSVLLSVIAGWPVARAFGLSAPAALAVSMALSLSSTAVVLRILSERRQLRDAVGRTSLAVLVTQDLLAILMLGALPVLTAWAGRTGWEANPWTLLGNLESRVQFLVDAAIRLSVAATLILVARMVLPRLLSESLRSRSLEVTLLIGLASALGAAVAAEALGLSLEMGAFVAGFVLADTAFQSQLSGQIGPLRDLFMALFFTTLGMKLGPQVLIESGWVIALGTAAMLAVKAGVIGAVSWMAGFSPGAAAAVALGLAQAGEFSLIVLGGADRLDLLHSREQAVLVAVVILSLLVTPALMTLGRRMQRAEVRPRFAPWIRTGRNVPEAPRGEDPDPYVVVGGFGPLGRRLVQDLEAAGFETVVVELNPVTVRERIAEGRWAVLGDVGNTEVLEAAGIRHARAFALTVPDDLSALRAIGVARRAAPGLFIAARVGTLSRVTAARAAGADVVLADETAAAEALTRAIVEQRP